MTEIASMLRLAAVTCAHGDADVTLLREKALRAAEHIDAQAGEIERLKESLHALTYWDNGAPEFSEAVILLVGWWSKQ